jgi:hypothetical protein
VEGQIFRLSFKKMFTWSMAFLLGFAAIALGTAIVLVLLIFFLSGLPLNLILSAVMLGVIPVALLIGFFIPLILLVCLLYSKLMRYEVNELGIVQSFGPVKNEMDWLQVQAVEESCKLKLRLLKMHILQKERPFTIFLGFLEYPGQLAQALLEIAPNDNPMREWVEEMCIPGEDLPDS